jgi:hypothetical protein
MSAPKTTTPAQSDKPDNYFGSIPHPQSHVSCRDGPNSNMTTDAESGEALTRNNSDAVEDVSSHGGSNQAATPENSQIGSQQYPAS